MIYFCGIKSNYLHPLVTAAYKNSQILSYDKRRKKKKVPWYLLPKHSKSPYFHYCSLLLFLKYDREGITTINLLATKL